MGPRNRSRVRGPAFGAPALLVKRGSIVESVHRAAIAVADPRGRLHASLGDPSAVTFMRSSAKPFQAGPLVASGAAERFGLTDPELALIAGSHGGEDRHTTAVQAILAKGGLGPEHLKCGVHKPYHGPTAKRIGEQATVLHHNCSGKHAGLLLLALHHGVKPDAYLDPASAGQRAIRRLLADVAGLKPAQVRLGTDGCSAPNFALPVKAMARAFACLAAPEQAPADHGPALARVRDAMRAHPGMVAGEGRFDTTLMEATQGALVSKSGAEGVQCVGWPARGLGLAVKVEDGAARASGPVTAEALRQLKALRADQRKAMEAQLGLVLMNWAGLEVGALEPCFRLARRGT